MKQITILASLFLGLTLQSCDGISKWSSDTTVIQDSTQHSESYFSGVIRFRETSDAVNEKLAYSQITMTLNQNSVKREVNTYALGVLTESYGMIYHHGQDTITYYIKQDEEYHYTKLSKAEYLLWVKELTRPQNLTTLEPFGMIFKPLPEVTNYTYTVSSGTVLGTLKACETLLIAYDNNKLCTIIYDPKLKISDSILELVEYHQPTALKTIALSVHYSQKERGTTEESSINSFLDQVGDLTDKVVASSIKYEGQETSETPNFNLPENATYKTVEELENLIHPPQQNTGGHHHHHDIF